MINSTAHSFLDVAPIEPAEEEQQATSSGDSRFSAHIHSREVAVLRGPRLLLAFAGLLVLTCRPRPSLATQFPWRPSAVVHLRAPAGSAGSSRTSVPVC